MLHAKKAMGVIRLLIKRYFQDQVGRSAAELAYYLLFSLFPLLIFINAERLSRRCKRETINLTGSPELPSAFAQNESVCPRF